MDTSGVRGLMRTVPLPGPSVQGRGERHRFSCSWASDNRIQPPSCCQKFSPGFVDVVGWKGQWSLTSAFLFTFLFIKLNTIEGGSLKVLLSLRMMQHCEDDLRGCRGAGCSLRVLDFSEKDPHVMSSALSFHSHIPINSTVLGCYLFLSSERETVQCCAGHTEVKVKSLGRARRFATAWTVAYQALLSMGFSRQGCWSELPFPSPGDLRHPGIEPGSPAL